MKTNRSSWRLLAIAVLYFALILVGALPDHLILFPSRNAIDPRGAVQRVVSFESGQLELWTAKSRSAQKQGRADVYVLRFYGNADRAERWVAAEADAWNERAVEIWGMNYPGFGGSSGPAKRARVAPASIAAFDALQVEARDSPIVLFGASLGTTAALHVVAHRSVAGLILHNPPAIFLLAERDEVVSPRFQHLVVDAYAGEKRVIALRGANHNDPIEGAALADLYNALDWLLPRTTHGESDKE